MGYKTTVIFIGASWNRIK